MGWIYVIIAAILELVGVIGLNKFSEKKTAFHALLFFAGSAALSFFFTSHSIICK